MSRHFRPRDELDRRCRSGACRSISSSIMTKFDQTATGPGRPVSRFLSCWTMSRLCAVWETWRYAYSCVSQWRRMCSCWTASGSGVACRLLCLLFVLLAFSCVAVDAQQRIPFDQLSDNKLYKSSQVNGRCQNIDIRNTVDSFKQLNGCRVIEGYLQIVLIDRANESDYQRLIFPELREVTGYVLLYRVYGLRTLRHIFPNLVVIRGHTLFHNFALVVYEALHMQEIGLPKLAAIMRGSVRIEKNPNLCFVDTIDWELIAGKGGHFIKGNKAQSECPNTCSPSCPRSPTTNHLLCWSSQHCQKVCPDKCGGSACSETNECCNKECIGGCFNKTPQGCVACRHVLHKNGVCMEHCPTETFAYLDSRCITETECAQLSRPSEYGYDGDSATRHWKPFNGTCTLDCPPGYEEARKHGNIYTCQKCKGTCQKECNSVIVDSIEAAQNLRGCTHIRGALEIQMGGGKNVIKELEENLASIEEVDHYLKIARSFPLVSLNFLRSLRIIHGKVLEKDQYAIVVYDNQNLQELWNWTAREHKLEVRGNGSKLFFHFNPKLCIEKIEELRTQTGLARFEERDVASNSNGDKVACKLGKLNVWIPSKHPTGVVMQWDNFRRHESVVDRRSLLGYIISYIEAPYKNVSIYDGRDACGGDGWKVDDVAASDEESVMYESHVITLLKPYTQYALYIKTYTIASERNGAESNITYFTTSPDVPSQPVGVRAFSNSTAEVILSWLPPLQPNGIVTSYNLYVHPEKDDQEFLDQKNFCHDTSSSKDLTKLKETPSSIWVDTAHSGSELIDEDDENRDLSGDGTCCACPKDKKVLEKEEEEVRLQIDFEDYLHNKVYIKREETRSSRNKRGVAATLQDEQGLSSGDNRLRKMSSALNSLTPEPPTQDAENAELGNAPHNSNGKGQEFFHVPQYTVNGTHFVIRNLSHFTEYTIAVEACRVRDPDERLDSNLCSLKKLVTVRTLPQVEADTVLASSITTEVFNHSVGRVRIKWDEPQHPNGLIMAYHLEYKKTNIQNIVPIEVCITRKEFQDAGHSYVFNNLPAGTYTLRIKSTSLAGRGEFSNPVSFVIMEPGTVLSTEAIVGIALAVMGVLAVVVVTGTLYTRMKRNRDIPNGILFASVNPEYVSAGDVYIVDEWEVPRDKIKLLQELGQGSFGMVYEGIATQIHENQEKIRCAVKTVNEHASNRQRIEFLNEASVMKAFNCNHVVKLLGVVSKGQPTLVVMELMANGDLKSYLRSKRPPEPDDEDYEDRMHVVPPTLRCILQMAVEIADGMMYLSAKKFVHRDLAARNCMVAEDLTVKIGDFGMTRDIYETDYYRKGTKGLLPVRWMSPESLKDGVFTSYSDVWSYGVVLWEMATLASQPYQGLSNEQVLDFVIHGGKMDQPSNCPDKLYALMRKCWQYSPRSRPTFADIVTSLIPDVRPQFAQVSYFHSPESLELRAHEAEASVIEDEVTPETPLRSEGDGDGDVLPVSSPSDDIVKSANSSDGSKASSGHSVANGFIRPKRTTEC